MVSARRRCKQRRRAKSFVDCLREFLTPAVWKQAQQGHWKHHGSARWTVQPLVVVLLLSTWSCGDSTPERFETAKAYCVALRPKRRRPGKTVQGFQKAVARLPMPVLRSLTTAVRARIQVLLAARLEANGFIPLGCDGSRLECPRSAVLERRLGQAGKQHSAPTLWVTALVHLRTGVLWSWRLGKGTASERGHLMQLLPTLPRKSLVVCDAGYHGFELCEAIVGSGADFLIRMSSKVTLYTWGRPKEFREGLVDYWPQAYQKSSGRPPLRLRLIRIRSRHKHDVWLLTSVLDRSRLSAKTASQFYRWRWENEGLFRTYKRTLAKVRLTSRTVRLVHREAESSLLATQLLLAQGTLALPVACPDDELTKCSPRRILREVRRELQGHLPARQRNTFRQRLSEAPREQRLRISSKVKRPLAETRRPSAAKTTETPPA